MAGAPPPPPPPRETARVWAAGAQETPFTTPFEVSAKRGRLWIRPSWAAADSAAEEELFIKGANWGGFESRLSCPEQVDLYRYDDYINFLANNKFNAVRFPLSDATVFGGVHDGIRWHKPLFCAEYSIRHSKVIDALSSLIDRLAARGIFVALDIHTMQQTLTNDALWCKSPGAAGTPRDGCAAANDMKNFRSLFANFLTLLATCAFTKFRVVYQYR